MNYQPITLQQFNDIFYLQRHLSDLNDILELAHNLYGDDVYSIKVWYSSAYNDEMYGVELSSVSACSISGNELLLNIRPELYRKYLEQEQWLKRYPLEDIDDNLLSLILLDYNEGRVVYDANDSSIEYQLEFKADDVTKNPLSCLYIGKEIN